jgi:hypothetical protein
VAGRGEPSGARARASALARIFPLILERDRLARALKKGCACARTERGHVQEKSAMDQSKMKIAYVVTQRGTNKYWTRIGVAFVNRDGSINVKLEAVPVSGEIHVRDYVPRDEREEVPTATLLKKAGNGHVDEAFSEPA